MISSSWPVVFDMGLMISKPIMWHGAPSACLKRCFLALGCPRLRFVDRLVFLKLRKLYNICFFEDENSFPLSNKLPDPQESQSGKRREFTEVTPGGFPPSAKKTKTLQDREGKDSSGGNTTTFCPILQREVHACWSLGPDASTEEAVHQFGLNTRSLVICMLEVAHADGGQRDYMIHTFSPDKISISWKAQRSGGCCYGSSSPSKDIETSPKPALLERSIISQKLPSAWRAADWDISPSTNFPTRMSSHKQARRDGDRAWASSASSNDLIRKTVDWARPCFNRASGQRGNCTIERNRINEART